MKALLHAWRQALNSVQRRGKRQPKYCPMSNTAYPDENITALPPSKRRRRESVDDEISQIRNVPALPTTDDFTSHLGQRDPSSETKFRTTDEKDHCGKSRPQNDWKTSDVLHSSLNTAETTSGCAVAESTLQNPSSSNEKETQELNLGSRAVDENNPDMKWGDPAQQGRNSETANIADELVANKHNVGKQIVGSRPDEMDDDRQEGDREEHLGADSVPRKSKSNLSAQMAYSESTQEETKKARSDMSHDDLDGMSRSSGARVHEDMQGDEFQEHVPRRSDAKRNSSNGTQIDEDHIPRANQSEREDDRNRRPSAAAPQGPPRSFSEAPNSQKDRGLDQLSHDVADVLHGLFERGFFEERDIDERAIDFLASVPSSLALAALEDIQHRDFSTVRNKPAFIFSNFKRVVAAGGPPPSSLPPPGGFPPATVPPSALAHLPSQVSDALQRVFTSGVCHPSQFDDRAMDILVELHPADAVRALSEFAAMEPGRVRNPSAFWMGLARKYKNHSQNGGPMGGRGTMGYGASGGGGGSGFSPGPVGGGGGYPHHLPPGRGGYCALERRLDDLRNMGVLRPDSLDDRAIDALRKLPEQDALSVLSELPDPSRVRNMSAYVMGLCKKFATGEARSLTGGRGTGGYGGIGPGGGYGGGSGGDRRDLHDALSRMDPDVRGRFYAMVDRGMFPEHAFDHRAIGALQGLSVGEACAALDELAASDPRRIHNISAYFMGLAKKFGRV